MNKLAEKIHQMNVKKGFYDEQNRNIGELLCLIHAEISEALEAVREDKFSKVNPVHLLNIDNNDDFKNKFLETTKDTFEDEIADSLIRLLDLCGYKKINISAHIEAKLRYNSTRPIRHGKSF